VAEIYHRNGSKLTVAPLCFTISIRASKGELPLAPHHLHRSLSFRYYYDAGGVRKRIAPGTD
jgi:hypothetical protein